MVKILRKNKRNKASFSRLQSKFTSSKYFIKKFKNFLKVAFYSKLRLNTIKINCLYFYSFSLGSAVKTLKISQLTEHFVECPICKNKYEFDEMTFHYSEDHIGYECPKNFNLSKEAKLANLRSITLNDNVLNNFLYFNQKFIRDASITNVYFFSIHSALLVSFSKEKVNM